MSKSSVHLRTPLKKARNWGSAHHGASHWLAERLTALALIPLSLWFVCSLFIHVIGQPREAVVAWFTSPFTAILFLLFATIGLWHSKMGVQVIIEDYVHAACSKTALIILNLSIHAVLIVVSVAAVLKLHLVGI